MQSQLRQGGSTRADLGVRLNGATQDACAGLRSALLDAAGEYATPRILTDLEPGDEARQSNAVLGWSWNRRPQQVIPAGPRKPLEAVVQCCTFPSRLQRRQRSITRRTGRCAGPPGSERGVGAYGNDRTARAPPQVSAGPWRRLDQARPGSARPARDTCRRRPWRCWSGAGRLGRTCGARYRACATDGAVVEFEAVEGVRQRVVTEGSDLAQKVLKALMIRRNPPSRVQSKSSETTKSGHAVKIRK